MGLENAVDGELDVYWRTSEFEQFRRARRFTIPVKKGLATVTCDLASIQGPRCQFLLRPIETNQVSKIRWFELRTAAQ